MSIGKIFLQQTENDDDLYIVDRLVDRIVPLAGSVLTKSQVREFVVNRNVTVYIKRGNA